MTGVSEVTITEGEKPFKVKYDKSKVSPDQLIAALEKAGEAATVKK